MAKTPAFLFCILVGILANIMPCAFAQQSTAPPVAAQTSPTAFQQWLQKNGYAQNTATATVPLPPTANFNAPPAPTTNFIAPPAATTNFITPPPPNPFLVHRKHHQRRPSRFSHRLLSYEQGQQAMLQTVPPANPPTSDDATLAFHNMLQQNMPLSPRQVVQLHQQIDKAQRAASVPANIPPKPVSSTLMINLAPGTTPPAVRLAQGYVSSLVFVDSTGQPWPIAAFDIGNPKAVNMQWDGKSNILLMQAVSPYSDGDIVVRLVGNPTPITLELVSGQRVVDYRIDIHVSGIGPNTKEVPMGTALPNGTSPLLLGVLDGVSPAGSKLLTVQGADAEAWLLGEKMYLRTRLTVLSPGWLSTMNSPDGMHAYELPKTSSVLVSRYGEPAELKIEGF